MSFPSSPQGLERVYLAGGPMIIGTVLLAVCPVDLSAQSLSNQPPPASQLTNPSPTADTATRLTENERIQKAESREAYVRIFLDINITDRLRAINKLNRTKPAFRLKLLEQVYRRETIGKVKEAILITFLAEKGPQVNRALWMIAQDYLPLPTLARIMHKLRSEDVRYRERYTKLIVENKSSVLIRALVYSMEKGRAEPAYFTRWEREPLKDLLPLLDNLPPPLSKEAKTPAANPKKPSIPPAKTKAHKEKVKTAQEVLRLFRTFIRFADYTMPVTARGERENFCLPLFSKDNVPFRLKRRCATTLERRALSVGARAELYRLFDKSPPGQKELYIPFVLDQLPKDKIKNLYAELGYVGKVHIMRHVAKSPSFRVNPEQFLAEPNPLIFNLQLEGLLKRRDISREDKLELIVRKLESLPTSAAKLNLVRKLYRHFPDKTHQLYFADYQTSGENIELLKLIVALSLKSPNKKELDKKFLTYLYFPATEVRHLFIRGLSEKQVLERRYDLYIAWLKLRQPSTRSLLLRRLLHIKIKYKLDDLQLMDKL